MALIHLSIDGKAVECESGLTILEAARQVGLFLPALCTEPGLTESQRDEAVSAVHQLDEIDEKGCGLCMVELLGRSEPVRACETPVEEGMVVTSDSDKLKSARARRLAAILDEHARSCAAGGGPQRCLLCELGLHIKEMDRAGRKRG